jgi:hypothetical protein
MPTGTDNNIALEQAGADARRSRTSRKLQIAAGLMTALSWIAALAVVFRRLPSLDGLYDRLSIPLALTFVWFVSNSSQWRGDKRAMAMLGLIIISGFFWATSMVIELWMTGAPGEPCLAPG